MKKITYILIAFSLFTLASCVKDDIDKSLTATRTNAIGVEIATDGKSDEPINCARFIVFDDASEFPKLDINEFVPTEEIAGNNAQATGLSLVLKVSDNKDKILFAILNEPDNADLKDELDAVSHPKDLEDIEFKFADILNNSGVSISNSHKPAKNGIPMTGAKRVGEKHGYPVQETEEAARQAPLSMSVERAVARVCFYLQKEDAAEDVTFEAGGTVKLHNTYDQGYLVAGTEDDGTRYKNPYTDIGKMQTVTQGLSDITYVHSSDPDDIIDVTTDMTLVCRFYTPERTCNAADDADKLRLTIDGVAKNGNGLGEKSVCLTEMLSEDSVPTDITVIKRNNTYDVVGTVKRNGELGFSVNVKGWDDKTLTVSDNQYYLKVSQKEFQFSFEQRDNANTDNKLTVTTNHPSGWTAAVYGDLAGTTSASWLTVSSLKGDGKDNILSLNMAQNTSKQNTDKERTAYIHFTAGNLLRLKVKVTQQVLILPEIPGEIPNDNDVITYVGAFWRANQRAERLITIPTSGAERAGKWVVQVIYYGEGFKEGDIIFAEGLGNLPTNPNDPDELKLYVPGNSIYAAGTVEEGESITFRIGLTKTWDNSKVRYAKAVVSYGTDYQYHRVLYLRQGHEPDYLMRPGNGSKDGTDFYGRSLAAKFSPYNLTTESFRDADSKEHTVLLKPLENELGVFVKYPTQAGAFFQWARTDGAYAHNPGWPLSQPDSWGKLAEISTKYWDNDDDGHTIREKNETCPPGFRRPTSGPTDKAAGNPYPITPKDSEVVQSLFYHVSTLKENTVYGYYADGYFDRRPLDTQKSGSSGFFRPFENGSVNVENSSVAHIGRVFYNPYDGTSLFMPFAGLRGTSGDFGGAGTLGRYWLSSADANKEQALLIDFAFNRVNTLVRENGLSIRCVVDEKP